MPRDLGQTGEYQGTKTFFFISPFLAISQIKVTLQKFRACGAIGSNW